MIVVLMVFVALLSCHVCACVIVCVSLLRFSNKEHKTYCDAALQTDSQITTMLVQQPDGDFFVSVL